MYLFIFFSQSGAIRQLKRKKNSKKKKTPPPSFVINEFSDGKWGFNQTKLSVTKLRRLVDSTRGIILLMFDQEDGNRKVFTSVFLWVSVQAPNTVIESPRLPSRASGYNGNVIVVKGDGGWLIFVFWRRRRTKITPYCDHQRCRYLITSNKTWKFVKILFEVSIFFGWLFEGIN